MSFLYPVLFSYQWRFQFGQYLRLEIEKTFRVKWTFFQSFQTCNLIGGAMMCKTEDCKMEMIIVCKWNSDFRSNRFEWKKWSNSQTNKCCPLVPKYFRLIFQPVEPKDFLEIYKKRPSSLKSTVAHYWQVELYTT